MITYTISHNWGDALSWWDFDTRQVTGHKRRIPEVGDLLEAKMQSGKIAVFKFTEVKRCTNPPDMFFATVSDVGYKDEVVE